MENMIVKARSLKGEVSPPPSKSLLHRYIIGACLAKGISRIYNIALSEDIKATIEAMKKLGASIEIFEEENYLLIDGTKTFSNNFLNKQALIDCNESGSTLRFLLPLSIVKKNKIAFQGRGKLFSRPLEPYFNNFDKYDIKYFYQDEKLFLDGILKSGIYEIAGNISSQFITGLLFSLPLLEEDSKIIIRGNLESKAYVDMTLNCLRDFGIKIESKNYSEFFIKANQEYKTLNIDIESDFSQAAFFLVANAMGAQIDIKNLNLNSLQGDKKILDFISLIKNSKSDKKILIDGSETPDIVPILSLYSAYSKKEIEIINISRLRIKECDRLNATVEELKKLDYDLVEKESSILINSKSSKINRNNRKSHILLSSHSDHRIAMMIAIASFVYDGDIILDNLDCVRKSYPNFWEVFLSLGGSVSEYLGQ